MWTFLHNWCQSCSSICCCWFSRL